MKNTSTRADTWEITTKENKMYRTVTDSDKGYKYGSWTTKEAALKEADALNSKSNDLSWVEDKESNKVS
jgi:hypothetical protein